jgi:hypothetical protein
LLHLFCRFNCIFLLRYISSEYRQIVRERDKLNLWVLWIVFIFILLLALLYINWFSWFWIIWKIFQIKLLLLSKLFNIFWYSLIHLTHLSNLIVSFITPISTINIHLSKFFIFKSSFVNLIHLLIFITWRILRIIIRRLSLGS